MEIEKIAARALFQSAVALSASTALRNTICSTDELKGAYKAEYKKQLDFNIKALEDVISKEIVEKLLASLKEENLL